MPASHILILLAPFAISAGWFLLFTILSRVVYPRLAVGNSPNASPPPDGKIEYVGGYGQPVGKAAWVRWLELAYVVYHFPVLVPGCWLSRKDTCPWWLLLLTPLLYACILYVVLDRA
jgi:hypothetical protein